jgi:hypothetical protein
MVGHFIGAVIGDIANIDSPRPGRRKVHVVIPHSASDNGPAFPEAADGRGGNPDGVENNQCVRIFDPSRETRFFNLLQARKIGQIGKDLFLKERRGTHVVGNRNFEFHLAASTAFCIPDPQNMFFSGGGQNRMHPGGHSRRIQNFQGQSGSFRSPGFFPSEFILTGEGRKLKQKIKEGKSIKENFGPFVIDRKRASLLRWFINSLLQYALCLSSNPQVLRTWTKANK